jgi:hypothetical protein
MTHQPVPVVDEFICNHDVFLLLEHASLHLHVFVYEVYDIVCDCITKSLRRRWMPPFELGTDMKRILVVYRDLLSKVEKWVKHMNDRLKCGPIAQEALKGVPAGKGVPPVLKTNALQFSLNFFHVMNFYDCKLIYI